MTHSISRRSIIRASAGTAILACLFAGNALAVDVVVPGANASVAGNLDNRFPFFPLSSMRYQQVFAASEFSSLVGTNDLTGVTMRPSSTFNVGVPWSDTSTFTMRLSTIATGPDALSTTFASNVGANVTTVFNGSVVLSTANTAGPGNTRAFDILLNFTTPFAYNAAAGNLLMDVTFTGQTTIDHYMDAENTTGDSISRIWALDSSATVGNADSAGLIMQFHASPVPEPASMTALVLGAAGLIVRRRKRA